MIILGFICFIAGFTVALLLIQLMYVFNVKHAKKGEKLVSEGKTLIEQQQRINNELNILQAQLNGNG